MPRPARNGIKLLLLAAVVSFLLVPQLLRADFGMLRRVDLGLLLLGAALQVLQLAAYTMMTRVMVPPGPGPGFWRLFRIQLSSYAVSHVVPAGTAAGGVLGYRLLTTAGMRGTDAAFVMATQGVGSAVVLNVILWLALLVSIPLRGVNPFYGVAALLGVIMIGGFAAVVILLVRGEERAAGWVRAVATRLPLVRPDPVERALHAIAARLQVLTADRGLMLRATVWGALNWLVDAASLWVLLGAFGYWASPDGLLIAFGLANILAAIPVTPRGLGIVETVMIPTLVWFGAPAQAAVLGVLAYRLVNFWLPIPVGGLAYLSLEIQQAGAPTEVTRHEHRPDDLRTGAPTEVTRHEHRPDDLRTGAPTEVTRHEHRPDDLHVHGSGCSAQHGR